MLLFNLLIGIIPYIFLFFIFCLFIFLYQNRFDPDIGIYNLTYFKRCYAYLSNTIISIIGFINTKIYNFSKVSFWSFVLKHFTLNSISSVLSQNKTAVSSIGFATFKQRYFTRSDGYIEFGMELSYNNNIISPTLSQRPNSGITNSTISKYLTVFEPKAKYVSTPQNSSTVDNFYVSDDYPKIIKSDWKLEKKRCNPVGIVEYPGGFNLTGTAKEILALSKLNNGVISPAIIQNVFKLKETPFVVLTQSEWNAPYDNYNNRFKVPTSTPSGCYGWYCFGAEKLYVGGSSNMNTRPYEQLGDEANKNVLAHRKYEDIHRKHITGHKWILIFFKLTQYPSQIIHTTDSILNQWVSIEQGYINHFNYSQLYNLIDAATEGDNPHVPGPIFAPFRTEADKDPQKFQDMLNSMDLSNNYAIKYCNIAVNELYKDLLKHQVKMIKSYYTSLYPYKLKLADVRDLVMAHLLKNKPKLVLTDLLPANFILPAIKSGIPIPVAPWEKAASKKQKARK